MNWTPAELTELSMETLPYDDHYFSTGADRMLADIRAIGGPRHRDVHGSMQRARDYCPAKLTNTGWTVINQEFTPLLPGGSCEAPVLDRVAA
ncbi:hypothetical protein [Xylanimonas protaetiae]|uniref:Uncharacterized protein n=1 Tax=Xylanimonas protaetiae TaxID=2509457 RepID=A0A4P6F9M8_9MICO|nr:hypothetical protein [Xylanimonas protaetiae]QAY71633.1 hypothetical protein ET471_17640 [Xylanimonas protaetiae]